MRSKELSVPPWTNHDVTTICTVEFADGWTVRLRGLYCQATYADQRESSSTRASNDRLVGSMMHRAHALFGETPVHVIPPLRIAGRTIEGCVEDGQAGRLEALPPICCIGNLEAEAVSDGHGSASGLILVWFQSAPPPVPLEAALMDMLAHIRWEEHAANFWY